MHVIGHHHKTAELISFVVKMPQRIDDNLRTLVTSQRACPKSLIKPIFNTHKGHPSPQFQDFLSARRCILSFPLRFHSRELGQFASRQRVRQSKRNKV